MYGARRIGGRLTRQEEETIAEFFEAFCEQRAMSEHQTAKKNQGATRFDEKFYGKFVDKEKMREAFAKIHMDGNNPQDQESSRQVDHDIQLLLDDMDETGKGHIDWPHWRAMMTRKFMGEEDDSSFGHVFAMLDDNKDGFIPLVEFRRMLMQEGQAPLSEQEVEELLMFADSDSDGLIDYRDFLTWLSNPEAYAKEVLNYDKIQAARAAALAAKAPGPASGPGLGMQIGAAPASSSGFGPSSKAAAPPSVSTASVPAAAAAGPPTTSTSSVPPASKSAAPGSSPPTTKAASPSGSSGPSGPKASAAKASGAKASPPAGAKASPPAGKAKAAPPVAGKAKAAPPGAKAPPPAGAGVGGMDPKLQQLIQSLKDMGAQQPISEAKAADCLKKTGGNVDEAVSMFLG